MRQMPRRRDEALNRGDINDGRRRFGSTDDEISRR